jgi:hypothetical protein
MKILSMEAYIALRYKSPEKWFRSFFDPVLARTLGMPESMDSF